MKNLFESGVSERDQRRVVWVLAAAVLGISISGVLVRSMHDAEAIAIAAWRTALAGLVLSPGLRLLTRRLTRGELVRIVGAGVCLGMHFYVWFLSLEHTTVLRSTVLVCLLPIWVGLLEWVLERHFQGKAYWAGAAIAILGVGLMSFSGDGGTGQLYGDVLAVAGGILCAFYLLIGRTVRREIHVAPYMCLVCLVASASLWPVAFSSGVKVWGYEGRTWLLLAGAVVGPQLVGHQGFNYAIRYVKASVVSVVSLLEPVGATVLAAIILNEIPPPFVVVGALVVLAGVLVATKSESSPQESDSAASAT